jgi:quinol monooxygenase YgiN
MPVTVAIRRRARPGQAQALIDATLPVLGAAVRQGSPSLARIFQGRDDPHDLLLLGEWASRDAFWATQPAPDVIAQFDTLSLGHPQRYMLEQLALFESVFQPVAAASGVFLRWPTGTNPAANRSLWQLPHQQVRQQPGGVLHVVYRDLDDPDQLCAVNGWSSVAAMELFLQNLAPLLDALHAANAVQMNRFVGITRVELNAHTGT